MSYAEELEQKAPSLKAHFDQAMETGSDQVDRNAILAEHAILLAKYMCEVAYDRPGLHPQLLRQSNAVSGSAYGSLQATIDAARVDGMDANMAATFALEKLKKIVEFDRQIKEMYAAQAEQRTSGGDRGE